METPVNAPLKEKFRLEIAKLRKMPIKDKLEYIWEYYKIHIAAILILLFIIGSLLNNLLVNPVPDTVLFVSWNAGFAYDEQLTELADVLSMQLVLDARKESITINRIFMSDDDPQMAMASISQLVAMVSAGVIDVFILDSDLLDSYSGSGYIRPIDDILADVQSVNPAVYERIFDEVKLALHSLEEDHVEERSMGISIENSPLLSKLGFFQQDLYFAISVTAGNPENITKAIIAFFE